VSLFGENEAAWAEAQIRTYRDFNDHEDLAQPLTGNGAPGHETEGPAAEPAALDASKEPVSREEYLAAERDNRARYERELMEAKEQARTKQNPGWLYQRMAAAEQAWQGRSIANRLRYLSDEARPAHVDVLRDQIIRDGDGGERGFGGHPRIQELATLTGAIPHREFIASELGTPHWAVAPRMTKALKAKGVERVISPEALRAIDSAWGDEVLTHSAPAIPPEAALAAPTLKAFDDPAGEGPKFQADSLEHDLRVDLLKDPALAAKSFIVDEVGEQATLDAILSELDGDKAMVAALRGCL